MKKRYIFSVRLGDVKVTRAVDLEDGLDSAAVQFVYEGWRDGLLTQAWWPEEMDEDAKEMLWRWEQQRVTRG